MTKNVSAILDTIKTVYAFKTDVQLADRLGVKTTTISTWRKRNSFDVELIYAKCELIDGNFLLKGSGQIYRKKSGVISVNTILEYIKNNSEELNNSTNWGNFIENIELKAQKKLLIELNAS